MQLSSRAPIIGFAINDTRFAFWALMEQGALEQAQRMGLTVYVRTSNTAEGQAAVIRQFTQQRIGLLLVAPIRVEDPAFRAAIQDAQQAGIPIVTCESGCAEPPPFARCDVRANLFQAAQLATRALVARCGGRGIIGQLAGSQSRPRSKGFHAVVERYPAIQVVEALEIDWTREGAKVATNALLAEHPELSALYAHSDEMALGAVEAIDQAGRTAEVLVVGTDAMPEALQAIYAGRMYASVHLAPRITGRMAVELTPRILRNEQIAQVLDTPITLVQASNLLTTALDELSLLPHIIRALGESNIAQRLLQEDIIATQSRIIEQLSSPIIPISEHVLLLPLIGTIDSQRAKQMMDTMLAGVAEHRAQILIIDVSGVAVIDLAVAQHLLQSCHAIQLLGARPILVGIGPEVAQSIIQLGVDLTSIIVRSTLKAGLEYAAQVRQ